MKTLTTLALVICCLYANAQALTQNDRSNILQHLHKAPAKPNVPKINYTGSSRSINLPIVLDYDGLDQTYANYYAYAYNSYLWNLNSRYGNADNWTLRDAAVLFDSLIFINNNTEPSYVTRNTTAITVDSFELIFVHDHTTAGSDTLQLKIFDLNSYTTSPADTSAVMTTNTLWDTMIVANATIPLNTTNYTIKTFYPDVTLPQGHSFGIRVNFSADTANHFQILAGYRDECAAACGAAASPADSNSRFYFNYMTQAGYNLSGFGPLYFDCDANSQFTPDGCELIQIQNFTLPTYITVITDTVYDTKFERGGIVSGDLYIDVNQNNQYNSGTDYPIACWPVTIGSKVIYSDAQGHYSRFMPNGNYTVTAPAISYFTVSSGNAAQPIAVADADVQVNFGYTGNGPASNLSFLWTSSATVCSNITPGWIDIYNYGTTIEDARVTLVVDSQQTVAIVNGATISGNTVTWTVNNLLPLSITRLFIALQNPNFQSMGNTLQQQLTLERWNNNSWTTVTMDSFPDVVVCSYDPNDKRVVPQGPHNELQTLMDTRLEYTVRFQNTGNYPAATVIIRDTLNVSLNPATFKFIGSSHPVIINVDGSYVEFRFNNINLPDSGSNEPGSHGFVRFAVNPYIALPVGTQVDNTAFIYFDANPAVVTNTAVTQYVNQLNVGINSVRADFGNVTVVPNPSNGNAAIYFNNPEGEVISIKVFDAFGKNILSDKSTTESYLLKLDLPAGIYFAELTGNKKRAAIKIAVN